MAVPDIHVQLIKNDKKDSYVRQIQKQLRPENINSAFCQNAFDTAFYKTVKQAGCNPSGNAQDN